MKKLLILGLIALVGFGLVTLALWPVSSGQVASLATTQTNSVVTPEVTAASAADAWENGSCGSSSTGMLHDDIGPETRPQKGYMDNEGNMLQYVEFHSSTCDGYLANFLVRLSNDAPLETCDECAERAASWRAGIEEWLVKYRRDILEVVANSR